MLFGAFLFPFLLGAETGKADVTIEARSLGRHPSYGVSYANFKAHNNSYLAVTKVSYESLLCTEPKLPVIKTRIKVIMENYCNSFIHFRTFNIVYAGTHALCLACRSLTARLPF